MLTIQMLRLMDALWKAEGYDFRMTPYRCVSTNYKQGLIEVVHSANTIANIQKEKAPGWSAFKKGTLLAYLKDHNPDPDSLLKAIDEFTLSCAGYCVATYALGVADRHSDNIMLRTNGQLVHIDFGHILGNFKEKFGIRRERSAFVLANDFEYIITHNPNKGGKNTKKWDEFQKHCEQAFLILRRKGSYMINMFAMMISAGLPELSSVKDLEYLRDTLQLERTEAEALKHFRLKFREAVKNSFQLSVNWWIHNVAKDNK